MPRRRSLATMERDAQAADLYRRGLTYRQIAAQMGYRSPSSVVDAVRRAAREAARDSLAGEDALRLQLDRLQDYRRAAWRVLTSKHYVSTQGGKLVYHPETKQPLIDDEPVLRALDRLLKIDDHEAKLLGIYAPARARVEVITEDMVDAELKRLEEKFAELDQAAAGPGVA